MLINFDVEQIPLKQGLKLFTVRQIRDNIKDVEQIPLKQGLKQKENLPMTRMTLDVEQIPLKQGLKLSTTSAPNSLHLM